MGKTFEVISKDGLLAYIVRDGFKAKTTTFLTPPEDSMQMGCVVYEAGGKIKPHVHRPGMRSISSTAEFILVKKGRCRAKLYNRRNRLAATRVLRQGDMLLCVSGGHGFDMLKDTVIFEVKQGPYVGASEKKHFTR